MAVGWGGRGALCQKGFLSSCPLCTGTVPPPSPHPHPLATPASSTHPFLLLSTSPYLGQGKAAAGLALAMCVGAQSEVSRAVPSSRKGTPTPHRSFPCLSDAVLGKAGQETERAGGLGLALYCTWVVACKTRVDDAHDMGSVGQSIKKTRPTRTGVAW